MPKFFKLHKILHETESDFALLFMLKAKLTLSYNQLLFTNMKYYSLKMKVDRNQCLRKCGDLISVHPIILNWPK